MNRTFKLDGRTKFLTCIFFTLFMFSFHYYWQYGVITLFFVGLLALEFTKEQRQQLFQHWKLILFLPSLNLFANLFFVNGRVLWSWGWLTLTELDIQIFVRIVLLLLFALALTIKTTPQELALAVGKICHSLTFGHYHGSGLPLVIIIMATFINEFQETFVTVKQAYKLRASNQAAVHWGKRLTETALLLQPIILISMKKAGQVADALIAKGYHNQAHLFNYQAIKYHWSDWLIYGVLLLLVVGNLAIVHFGSAFA